MRRVSSCSAARSAHRPRRRARLGARRRPARLHDNGLASGASTAADRAADHRRPRRHGARPRRTSARKTGSGASCSGRATAGQTWQKTDGDPVQQSGATIDVDIVALPSGAHHRQRARRRRHELPELVLRRRRQDLDRLEGCDTTRRPGSPVVRDTARRTRPPRAPVYLLYHNLASGQAQHNMFVSTSTDSGATFGPPVPITLPGDDAYTDLQCADSGGPSTIS